MSGPFDGYKNVKTKGISWLHRVVETTIAWALWLASGWIGSRIAFEVAGDWTPELLVFILESGS